MAPRELRTLRPAEVDLHPAGMMIGTLGHGELEFAGAALVLYHLENELAEWTPIKAGDFFAWANESEALMKWATNPFWRPDFIGLIDGGWIEGWNTDDDMEKRMAAVGTVSAKFIEAVSNPRIGPKEDQAVRVHS